MKKLLTLAIAAILFAGCGDFGSTNVDPNEPATPRTDLLMTDAQRAIGDNVGAVTGTLYVQYFAENQYTDDSNYSSNRMNWSGWYAGPLQDLQTIINLNSDEETSGETYVQAGGNNANQIAVARILKAYIFHMMTDRWGNIPYSEALQGSENFAPSYDSQEDIYNDLLTELKEATAQIEAGADAPTGDYFLGDMGQWERFANTLRARIALRMSEVAPNTAETEFTAARDDGLIQEDIMYPYLDDENNDNPWQDRYQTRDDYAISVPMVDIMKNINDQRLLEYASPAPDEDNGDGVTEFSEVVGMPYGLEGDDAGAIEMTATSPAGSAVGYENTTAPLPVMTLAEVRFMEAEAAQRNWITDVAADLYEDAIQASWEQWGVYDATEFANYMSQGDVQYDPNNWEESIGVQKWIALFPQGYEAWSEWRRLGFPELQPGPGAVIPDIPVRMGYPATEAELNSENYEEAMQDVDDLQLTPVWWDVN